MYWKKGNTRLKCWDGGKPLLHAHNEHNARIADEIHAFLEGPRSTLTATCGQEQCKRPSKANHATLARLARLLSIQRHPQTRRRKRTSSRPSLRYPLMLRLFSIREHPF